MHPHLTHTPSSDLLVKAGDPRQSVPTVVRLRAEAGAEDPHEHEENVGAEDKETGGERDQVCSSGEKTRAAGGTRGGGDYIFRESIATMFSVAAPLEYTRYMWGKGSLASLPGLPGHRTTLKEK